MRKPQKKSATVYALRWRGDNAIALYSGPKCMAGEFLHAFPLDRARQLGFGLGRKGSAKFRVTRESE